MAPNCYADVSVKSGKSLSCWIDKLDKKKNRFARFSKKNLLAIAVLSNSLNHLRYLKRVEFDREIEEEAKKAREQQEIEMRLAKDPVISEFDMEISGFMSQLKEIKTSVTR